MEINGAAIDAQMSMAFGLYSSPGAYAMLLGAGVSISSGVPSAWGVQDELILRLARLDGAEPEDRFAWYRDKYGTDATYDALLEGLAASQTERQALLKGFFEPTDEERAAGDKRPSVAHHAIARLVAAGRVRIILTINFDRLMEQALREQGIEPTVVANPSDIQGLNPLHSIRCLVVHIHGDYLNPTGMINTSEELAGYPQELDNLLDEIFSKHGLVIAGWSATWDTALRAAVSRNPCRFYSDWWIDPNPLSDVAETLRVQRGATLIEGTANDVLGRLADNTDAIADTRRRDPMTVPVLVANAKRHLAGRQTAMPLHDTLRQELQELRSHPTITATEFQSHEATEFERRFAALMAGVEPVAALVSTCAYWGSSQTDDWWFEDIARFARRRSGGGSTALLDLRYLPAPVMIYAAGTAALAAHREDLVARVLTQTRTQGHNDSSQPVLEVRTLGNTTAGVGVRRVYDMLRDIQAGPLALGSGVFDEAWDRFEVLRLAVAAYRATKASGDAEHGIHLLRKSEDLAREAEAMPVPQLKESIEAQRDQAETDARARIRNVQASVPYGYSRVLVRPSHPNYGSVGAIDLIAELNRDQSDHPLLLAGLFDGNADAMLGCLFAVHNAIGEAGPSAWQSGIPSGRVWMGPVEDFWLDEAKQLAADSLIGT